jgi:predicted RecA/RadA family phage recombinase
MSALTIERKTDKVGSEESAPAFYQGDMNGGAKILSGAIVCVTDATGYLTKGASGTGLTAIGIADKTYDNTSGATGATSAKAQRGVFLLDNGTTGAVTASTARGSVLYMEDDHTVTTTSTTHSIAGRFWGMDPAGSGQVAVMIGVEQSQVGVTGATGAAGATGVTGATGASLEMFKRDIETVDVGELAAQALAIDIKSYMYKDGRNGAKRNLGFMINQVGQDSPAVAGDGAHVDVYGFATMLLAVVQTQQKQIERLAAQLNGKA